MFELDMLSLTLTDAVRVKWGGKFKTPRAVPNTPGVQLVMVRVGVNLKETVEQH